MSIENYLQEKVNEVAKVLIEAFPGIAESTPEKIGEMSKSVVFAAAELAAEVAKETDPLEAAIRERDAARDRFNACWVGDGKFADAEAELNFWQGKVAMLEVMREKGIV